MFRALSLIALTLTLTLALGGCAETRRHDGEGAAQNADAEGSRPGRKSTPPAKADGTDGGCDDDSNGAGLADDCNADDGGADDTGGTDTADAGDADGDDDPKLREPCRLDAQAQFELQTAEDLVELINSMPMPVTLPCLLDVLPRPLRIVATSSGVSIQPALDEKNPRIFALTGRLILAVVPDGMNASLLELSEVLSSTTSIKGEIEFPVTEPLAADAPYRHTDRFDGSAGTRCAACHGGETLRSDGRYESRALRPVSASVLSYTRTLDLQQVCAKDPSPRCEILNALFGLTPGDAMEGQFPADMPTIF